jgi:hypothetical protein
LKRNKYTKMKEKKKREKKRKKMKIKLIVCEVVVDDRHGDRWILNPNVRGRWMPVVSEVVIVVGKVVVVIADRGSGRCVPNPKTGIVVH